MTSNSQRNTDATKVLGAVLLGTSQRMQRLRALIVRLAPCQAPVLVEGPTGSGKELVAESLHLCSGRPGTFVPFNVCAIGDSMFESALFGHVRGAFTGAIQDSPGYLAEAHRGTAFFDEIGSLALSAQAKLLRAIETRSFRPVGARHNTVSDFRIIAASNDDLAALVSEGRFRADLFHRLRGMVVHVPALTDHIEDVPLLARHFARELSADETTQLSDGAVARLMSHEWPGNVRELRNVVEFALALADGPYVSGADVSQALGSELPQPASRDRDRARCQLLEVLAECAGDTGRAARRLGMNRSNLYRKMRRLGIDTPKRRRFGRNACDKDPSVSVAAPKATVFAVNGANSHTVHANNANARHAKSQ